MLLKKLTRLNPNSRWTVKKLLISAYGVIFLVTVLLYSTFGVLLIRSHLATAQKLFVQKIEATLRLNENEFLDELALRDLAALKNHLEIILKNLNADQIFFDSGELKLAAENSSLKKAKILTRFPFERLFLSNNARFSSEISNDFGTLTARIEVTYLHQIYDQIFRPAIDQFLLSFVFACSAETLLFLLLFALLRNLLIHPLQRLASVLKNGASGADDLLLDSTLKSTMLAELSDLLSAMVDYQKIRKKADVADLAGQVSHDIRSPLTALDTLLRHLNGVPESTRVFVRTAITRIRDIANTLLSASTDRGQGTENEEAVMVISEVDLALSGKRVEYRNKPGITIECAGCDFGYGYGLFVKVDPVEFARVLSNLINNSVRSCHETGTIQVIIGSDADSVLIEVKDDGCGIDPSKLAELNQRSAEQLKLAGNGYGVRHAKEYVTKWSGTLRLSSRLGKGTSVHIRLPHASAPSWFLPHLNVTGLKEIVILDDDASIHGVWENRFSQLSFKRESLSMVHLRTEQELAGYLSSKPLSKEQIFLVDYELINDKRTGPELIKEFGLEKQSILVTSRWNEPNVRKKCTDLEIKVLPKGMASLLPILGHEIEPIAEPACVLIDDDILVGEMWNIMGAPLGKLVAAFQTPDDFLSIQHQFSRDIPVYVDSKLRDGVKGEMVAKDLFHLGFKNITLATALPAEHFAGMTWLKDVRGKDCPWAESAN